MSGFSGGNPGPREVSYLFVDGGAFRVMMDRFHRDFFPNSAIPRISYDRVGHGFTKVFYYDCPPPRGSNETQSEYDEKQTVYAPEMRELRSLHGWHVFEGVTKRTGKKATQKEVDVLIAVDMLTHTYRRNMHRLAFITGDQDFRPLLEAIVREGMFVELRYDPSSTSQELLDAADSRQPIDPHTMHYYLDESFRRAHPMPSRSGEIERFPPDAAVLQTGRTNRFETVEIVAYRDKFMIVYPDLLNEGRFQRLTHSDRSLLELTFERSYGPVQWCRGV